MLQDQQELGSVTTLIVSFISFLAFFLRLLRAYVSVCMWLFFPQESYSRLSCHGTFSFLAVGRAQYPRSLGRWARPPRTAPQGVCTVAP